MDRLFDRLGDMLRAVLGGDGAGAADRGPQRRRPLHTDDPDLAAAWEELESFLDGDDESTDGARSSTSGTTGAGAPHPREPLRADYATLGVAFDAPLSEVKRAYKRLMQAHHPDRFAHDPARQADATRKAALINSAFARIEREARTARE
ncbi:MAG: J domain-containing protein [Spirochaetaceae bacterium]|nr:J domain-containing protein [Spirochaetaceae bacterium]